MRPRDIALAVLVAAIWGCNFVAIETGLDRMPPLLFSTLRFAIAALPAIFFVGKPQVPWRWVVSIGLILGVVKFALLFAGMAAGMPAGLSSLVLQSQAIFTVAFAFLFLREKPRAVQLAGLAVAALGVCIVAARFSTGGAVGAFILVVGAAATWGVSNVAMKKAAPADMLRFMVWVSAVATLPLAGLSLAIEGTPSVQFDLPLIGSLAYIAWISTLAGFAIWGTLIRRYGAGAVAPFSMLVPFFGMSSAALFLSEPLHAPDLLAGLLVIGGVLAPSFIRARPTATDAPAVLPHATTSAGTCPAPALPTAVMAGTCPAPALPTAVMAATGPAIAPPRFVRSTPETSPGRYR